LVTRTGIGDEVTARVLSPTDPFAAMARAQLDAAPAAGVVDLFAGINPEYYVDALLPRPLEGLCTLSDSGVACAKLDAIRTGG
jgi:hypothetical protein